MQDCHSCDPGSIPGAGANLTFLYKKTDKRDKQVKKGRLFGQAELSVMVELIDYKCATCGSIESFHRERNGISCKACGSRVFMKLRRTGTKKLNAE